MSDGQEWGDEFTQATLPAAVRRGCCLGSIRRVSVYRGEAARDRAHTPRRSCGVFGMREAMHDRRRACTIFCVSGVLVRQLLLLCGMRSSKRMAKWFNACFQF